MANYSNQVLSSTIIGPDYILATMLPSGKAGVDFPTTFFPLGVWE